MNWEAIGAIGDLLGGAAVVASLIFVGLQIRSSTNVARAAARQAVSDSVVKYSQLGIDNDALTRVFSKQLTRESFDAEERTQIFKLASIEARTFENIHYQYKQGLLEKEEWIGHREALKHRFVSTSPSSEIWKEYWQAMKSTYSADFVHEIDKVTKQ